jgi:tetratricopeptide (TPR) repeat protein
MRNGPTQCLQPNLSRMLWRALRALEQGEFDKAERLYTAVLQSDADNFDALHGLGLINYRRGRLDAALALIQAALKADLDRADGFSSLGLVFHALKQIERALKSYDEGLRLAPDDAELLNRRGVALLELGRPQEALDNFERVLAAAALPRRPWQTPVEFMAAVLGRAPLPPDPVRSLTGLFELARFSQHPVGAAERESAWRSLIEIRAALERERQPPDAAKS